MTQRTTGEVVGDRFELLGLLGQGGHGVTYRARDRQTGAEVALKELSLARAANWKAVELFRREGAVLRGLKHPGIPRYLAELELREAGVQKLLLAQSLAPGETLETRLTSGWRPSSPRGALGPSGKAGPGPHSPGTRGSAPRPSRSAGAPLPARLLTEGLPSLVPSLRPASQDRDPSSQGTRGSIPHLSNRFGESTSSSL